MRTVLLQLFKTEGKQGKRENSNDPGDTGHNKVVKVTY